MFFNHNDYGVFAKINENNIYIVSNQIRSQVKFGLVKLKKRIKRVKYISKTIVVILKDGEIYESKDGYFMNQFTANKLKARMDAENKLRNQLAEQIIDSQNININDVDLSMPTGSLNSLLNYKPEFWPLERESKYPLTEMFYAGTEIKTPCMVGIKITT